MDKQNLKSLSIVLFSVGVILLLNSFPTITGFAIIKNIQASQSATFGFIFIIGGIFTMLISQKTEKASELERKLKGTDVEIHTIFVRHGEKDKSGQLTYKGREQARDYGKGLNEKDAIKGYSSSIQRAIDTTEEIIRTAPHNKKLKTRIRDELTMPPLSEKFAKQYIQHCGEDKDESRGADWYLRKRERVDKQSPTAKEMAEGFAYILKKNIKIADKLYPHSKIDLVHGTHMVFPESLLKEVIVRQVNGKKVRGFKSIKEIGGILSYTEPVEFITKTDDSGKKYLTLNFRDKEYDVDMKRLNQLADSYARKKKK